MSSVHYGAPRLEMKGLSKVYGGKAAIDDVGFTVHAGEFVALLGHSGAGKTTLFRCMAGLIEPESGTIRADDLDIAHRTRRDRRHVAVIFQQFNLVKRLSAMDNVLAGRLGHVQAWRGWTRCFTREDRALALDCLERVGLRHKADQRADTLSGGEQQRVAIARAIAQQPRAIVADEPVASLDPKAGAGILDLLRGICRRDGVALVCSLHQVHLAQAYADRIVGLNGGRVVIDMPAEAFDTAAELRLYGHTHHPEPPAALALP